MRSGSPFRLVYQLHDNNLVLPGLLALAFSPDGRLLAFALPDMVGFVDMRTSDARIVHDGGHDIAWSPDGHELLLVHGEGDQPSRDFVTTGDVKAVTPEGRVSTVVSGSGAYGGQIVSAAWAKVADGVRYRAPQSVDGVFAGGPVQELAADGGRVAFISCRRVSTWSSATNTVVSVTRRDDACFATFSRGELHSLALAGNRVTWVENGYGLCFSWTAHEATIGSAPIDLGKG